MNQILTTKPVKQRNPVNIKTIRIVFAICLLIFGICLITSSSYALYKHRSSLPKATTPSSNDSSDVSEPNYSNPYDSQSGDAGIEIHLSVEATNIEVNVTGENVISYITYKWDNEDEQRKEIGSSEGNVTIEVPEGEHTLTVTAVDERNNTKTKEQTVQGVTNIKKPKLAISQDGENFVLKMSDDEGLQKVDIEINGKQAFANLDGKTEAELKIPMDSGENIIRVKLTNKAGGTESIGAKCVK